MNDDPFVLEVPPYRFPTTRQMLLRGWHEVGHFLRRATRFIVAGVVLVWLLTNFPAGAAPGSLDTWAGQIGGLLNPVLSPLGIDPKLTIALIFGFVAKEVVIGALAVIYAREGGALMTTIAGQIDWVQAYSFMLFTLIYTPCLSTIATIRSEARSRTFTALAVAWPLALAWAVSFVFYQGTRAYWACRREPLSPSTARAACGDALARRLLELEREYRLDRPGIGGIGLPPADPDIEYPRRPVDIGSQEKSSVLLVPWKIVSQLPHPRVVLEPKRDPLCDAA